MLALPFGNLKSRWLRQVLQRLSACYNSILHENLTRFSKVKIDEAVAALSVGHRASAVQKKFRGSPVICLSAVVENPFDIFFFSFFFFSFPE